MALEAGQRFSIGVTPASNGNPGQNLQNVRKPELMSTCAEHEARTRDSLLKTNGAAPHKVRIMGSVNTQHIFLLQICMQYC
jgi:hypothetical protein